MRDLYDTDDPGIPVYRDYRVTVDLDDVMSCISTGWEVVCAVVKDANTDPRYVLVLPPDNS